MMVERSLKKSCNKHNFTTIRQSKSIKLHNEQICCNVFLNLENGNGMERNLKIFKCPT